MRWELDETPLNFGTSQSVPHTGVLLLLPFLIETGLLSYRTYYMELKKGYYYINFIILLLSFMYLCRIKNPEQLKHLSPGEFGLLMGIDRIPEVRCLRKKLKEITAQGKSEEWNMDLANRWTSIEENEFYYIDGHVQVYSGYKASLGKKHVSRQKLCLPGMQEFWINNHQGLPYFYVTGEVNEKLLEMLSDHILPKLLEDIPQKYSQSELQADADLPRFTIIFDREGYSPAYFKKLWMEFRVAVITYRKNVKELWDEGDFISHKIEIGDVSTGMKLSEKAVELNGFGMREIRKLSGDGHQTSIISTNKKLTKEMVAINMFSRWTQENYFKYLSQEYDFDRLLQYAVESIDNDFVIVNPEYNNLSYHIKKTREKISRRKAKLYQLEEENVKGNLDDTAILLKKSAQEKEELDALLKQEDTLLLQRKDIPYKIKISDMPENIRYNRLHLESKHFQNIIKMICYRAESSFANILSVYYKRKHHEKRAFVKSIINCCGDIIPDYNNNTLTVNLYSLSSQRMNEALFNVCKLLNDTETVYPGTNLVLKYKIATNLFFAG